jgi:uncharacterized YigZ family protein
MSARFSLTAPAALAQHIRKSIFVANAKNATSPDDALRFIGAVSDANATHNCWAYRIGQQYRFADDGEPGGTAGKPILQAIDGQHCDNTVVVVTRWFGGIKLGAGGLARAYGGCATECLRLASKAEIIERVTLTLALPFSAVPVLQARFHEFLVTKLDASFDVDGVRWRLALPKSEVAGLRQVLADLTRGRCELQLVD